MLGQMSPAAICVQILARRAITVMMVLICIEHLSREKVQAAGSNEDVGVAWFPASAQPLAALAMVISKSLSNTGSSVVINVPR